MALWSSTSRPKRNTRGSRSISAATASRRASTYRRIRCESVPFLFREYIGVQLLRLGKGTSFREIDSFCDLFFHFSLDHTHLCGVEFGSNPFQWILGLPLKQLITAAVTGIIILCGTDVFAPTVGVTLDKNRSAHSTAHSRYGVRCKLANGQDVGIRHLMRSNAVRADAFAQPTCGPALFDRRVNREEVVFADEQDGKAM